MLSLVLLAVTAAIKLDSRGPVLFSQNRDGFGDRVFQGYKFRTMKAASSDADGEKQTELNDPRITRIGGLARCATFAAIAGETALGKPVLNRRRRTVGRTQ